MKTIEEIKKELNRAKGDERLKSPTATIVENAPLALIQLELETTIRVLKWVLKERGIGNATETNSA